MALYERQAIADNHTRRTDQRLGPEQLVRLAQALPAGDRLLLEQRFGEGMTIAELARRSRRSAQALGRRIDRLTDRLASPEFRFTVLHQDRLPKTLRRTATLLFVQGRSLRDTARLTRRSLHQIRCDRAMLQTLARVELARDLDRG